MMNHTVQHTAECREMSLCLRCQKKMKKFSHRRCSELWDTSMTISGTTPVSTCDVSWCACTDTCMCKLQHILIGVRTCHSVHMEHAYAHVYVRTVVVTVMQASTPTYADRNTLSSESALSLSLWLHVHVCERRLLLQILIGVISLLIPTIEWKSLLIFAWSPRRPCCCGWAVVLAWWKVKDLQPRWQNERKWAYRQIFKFQNRR